MNPWFILILGGLATFRLTCLVSRDLGPYRVFARLRALSPGWFGCPFCFSITAGALVTVALYFLGIETRLVINVLFVLAFSAISIILDRTWTADHNPK